MKPNVIPLISGLPDVLFRAVFETAKDAIVIADHQGTIVFWNPAATVAFGYSEDEMVGQALTALMPERFRAAHGHGLQRFIETGEAHVIGKTIEVMGLHKDGTEFPIELSLAAASSDGGRFFTGVIRDITERRRAEQALRTSEEKYRRIVETTHEGVCVNDRELRIVFANRRLEEMLGYEPGELLGRHVFDLMDDEGRRMAAEYAERRRQGIAESGELRVKSKDGADVWVRFASSAITDTTGLVGTFAMVMDITDRKRAEQALGVLSDASIILQHSLDYEQTLRNLSEFLVPRLADCCVLDLVEAEGVDCTIASYRRATSELRVQRRHHRSSELPPVLVPVVDDAWLQAATRDEAHREPFVALGPTSILGVPLIVRDVRIGTLFLAMVDSGRSLSASDLSVMSGVADRVALAIYNDRLYAGAVNATRLRDDVLAIVSHDLRGPLASIRASAQLLALDGDKPPLGTILRGVGRANRLIEDLLTAAIIDSGKLALDCQPESMASIVDEIVELHRPLTRSRSIELEVTVDQAIPAAVVDRHRVVQAISNVVGNAVKFTPVGGRIELQVQRAEEMVAIVISDSGPGIPVDERAHLFDRFWQGANARRAGAGLGLAITKGVVDAHGGEVRVQCLGKGTTFTLRFWLAGPRGAGEVSA